MPRTDAVLADPRLVAAVARLGDDAVKAAVRAAQEAARRGAVTPDAVTDTAVALLPIGATTMRRVLNATGVVLHTNLGRAPLSDAAIDAMTTAAGYVDVEYDVESGARSSRGRGALAALLEAVPAAEAALVVNNAAAALVLAATALADGRQIVVSRGELIEIGDGFRLPELLQSTGATLHEVGTTNRTTAADYRVAVGADTGFVLKVHPSNYVVTGFTASPTVKELRELDVTLVVDIGSGLLRRDPLLPDEPDASSVLAAGADVVIASGDKLLGGPQAGVVLGRREIIDRMRRHPIARALRIDKLRLAALEATLRGPVTPTTAFLHADERALLRRADELAAELAAAGVAADVVPSSGVVGGGGAPDVELAGWAVAVDPSYAARLRCGDPCVVARIERDRCLVDLRCIPPAADRDVLKAVLDA